MAEMRTCCRGAGGPGIFAHLSVCRSGSVAWRAERSEHRWSSLPRRLEAHHLRGRAVMLGYEQARLGVVVVLARGGPL